MKLALLSNVNVSPVIRQLKAGYGFKEILEAEGYGNEQGMLSNPDSSLNRWNPQIVFLMTDLMELVRHELDLAAIKKQVDSWFDLSMQALRENTLYYISDAYLYGPQLQPEDSLLRNQIESIWNDRLGKEAASRSNVRIFAYSGLIRKMGENSFFSAKMWYMGRIPFTVTGIKAIAKAVADVVRICQYTPKKVLVLDLDHTLWGGLAGEHEICPVKLSDDGEGLAYKNLQRIVLRMKEQGVILAISSKNNEKDALDLINGHPHMVLGPDDFAVMNINWEPKAAQIKDIAEQLGVGLDAVVFFDDSPRERELVRRYLPDVTVVSFEPHPEALAPAMRDVWNMYFRKPLLTDEDRTKTQSYLARRRREADRHAVNDYESYLKSLSIRLIRVAPESCVDRLAQLAAKTNQFNLTSKRFSQNEIIQMLQDADTELFAYRVKDRFGDSGVVAMAVVKTGYKPHPCMIHFAMSCRVMGYRIENAIVEDIENHMRQKGYSALEAEFIPSARNLPVKELYPSLGYKLKQKDTDRFLYTISLSEPAQRIYTLTKEADQYEGKDHCGN